MRDFCTDYANALFCVAEEENAEKTYLDQLSVIRSVIKENDDFIKLLDCPAIGKEERLSVAEECFAGAEHGIISFIKLLTEKRRAFCLKKCIDIFERLYDDKNNIERAVCITAVPLSLQQNEQLAGKLEKITGKSIILTNQVNPHIMGGVLLRLKNREINGSVALRLKEIEKAIRI